MVRTKLFIVLFVVCLLLVVMSCAKRMTDDEYQTITEQYSDELAAYAEATGESIEDMSEEFQEYADNRLEELVAQYGYTVNEFERKMNDMGDSLEGLYDRADDKLQDILEMMEEEIEEVEEVMQ
jgi:translation initiation factor 2 alpha subunit (eIF-2alpha)